MKNQKTKEENRSQIWQIAMNVIGFDSMHE